MVLLETILPKNGDDPLVDPMKAHSMLFHEWPASSDPGWICRGLTPDPFYIEAMSLFVIHDPGTLLYRIGVLRTNH